MKESFSGTALFMIVIFFIVLFTGYLCFSINQSRAFSVKNAIVRIVERYGYKSGNDLSNFGKGRNGSFKKDIQTELQNIGYTTTGRCDSGWAAFNVRGDYVSMGGVGAFCIKVITANASNDNPANTQHYYKIKTFYHFDIPGVKELLRLTVEGNTKSMQ